MSIEIMTRKVLPILCCFVLAIGYSEGHSQRATNEGQKCPGDSDGINSLSERKDSLECKPLLAVNIVYDTPVNGYYVSGTFYPFDSTSETGQIELVFAPVNGGDTLFFSNVGSTEIHHPDYQLVFSGKNICDIVFDPKFSGFNDGDTFTWHYYDTLHPSFDSPLYYDAEFQFYDVDNDGKDEFLTNDYSKGRWGNDYYVYEIVAGGRFVIKAEPPYDNITNLTKFKR